MTPAGPGLEALEVKPVSLIAVQLHHNSFSLSFLLRELFETNGANKRRAALPVIINKFLARLEKMQTQKFSKLPFTQILEGFSQSLSSLHDSKGLLLALSLLLPVSSLFLD